MYVYQNSSYPHGWHCIHLHWRNEIILTNYQLLRLYLLVFDAQMLYQSMVQLLFVHALPTMLTWRLLRRQTMLGTWKRMVPTTIGVPYDALVMPLLMS